MKSKKELLWGRGGIGGTWGYHLIFSDCDPNRDISTTKFNQFPLNSPHKKFNSMQTRKHYDNEKSLSLKSFLFFFPTKIFIHFCAKRKKKKNRKTLTSEHENIKKVRFSFVSK